MIKSVTELEQDLRAVSRKLEMVDCKKAFLHPNDAYNLKLLKEELERVISRKKLLSNTKKTGVVNVED